MSKKLIFLLLFMPVFSLPMKRAAAGAMSAEQPPPCKLLATPNDNIIEKIRDDIERVQNNGYIGIETPSLTNRVIIEALKQAKQKGAQVKIFVNDPQQENNPIFLNDLYRRLREESQLTITQIPQLHAKRIVIAEKISAQENDNTIVYLGSLNLTEESPLNYEIMMRCEGTEFFRENYQDQHRLGTQSYQQEVEPIDFKTQRVIPSESQEARTAKKDFIQDYASCSYHPHDHLYLSSFTLTDNDIINSLIQAKTRTKKPVTVIVDGNIFYKHDRASVENRQYLKKLIENGINVYVFNMDGSKTARLYPKLFHIKALLRNCNQKCNVLISNANFTRDTQSQINHDLWQPCSPEFSMKLKRLFNRVMEESTKLTSNHFPPLIGNARENGKRLLDLMKYPSSVDQNQMQILQLIGYADLTITDDEYGSTPLIKAINANNIEVVRALIQAGANVNIIVTDPHTKEKTTPLLHVRNMPMLQLLLDAGINDTINYSNKHGNTPLFYAVSAQNLEMVRALLQAGADPDLPGDYRESGMPHTSVFWRPPGSTPPLIQAVRKGNLAIVNELLNYNANINAVDREGKTAFDHAKSQPQILDRLQNKMAREGII